MTDEVLLICGSLVNSDFHFSDCGGAWQWRTDGCHGAAGLPARLQPGGLPQQGLHQVCRVVRHQVSRHRPERHPEIQGGLVNHFHVSLRPLYPRSMIM